MAAGMWLVWLAAAPVLTFCYEDVPMRPWTTPDGRGLNFELLHRVEAVTGEHFRFVARPWKRCLEETRSGVLDGVVASADTPERRAYAVFPMQPSGKADARAALYAEPVHVYLRRQGAASWDGKALRVPQGGVIAQSGYHAADLLAARGHRVVAVKDAEEGLRLLASGLADAAALQSQTTLNLARRQYAQQVRVVQPPYVTLHYYLMVGRRVYQRDPARIERIWAALAAERATASYRKQEQEALEK